MKMTRSDMKALVKECLLEILNEGLGGAVGTTTRPTSAISRPLFTDSAKRMSSPTQQQRTPTPHLRDAVRREAGGNKIMESILADTAASSLPKMLQGESKSPPVSGGLAERVVAETELEEIFGDESTSKWASLAFMDSPTKK